LLRLVAAGRTDAEIGARLYVSKHTVSKRLSRLARLLGLQDYSRRAGGLRARLSAWAGQNGLLAGDG
jgi:DNA-binding NarL/FixJ family response regulator